MSETPAGRRGNGLHAADWGALVDLDPRLAEGLLDKLAGAGVAAYVEPATATDLFSRASLPERPLDRLWVDPEQAATARDVVAAEVRDLSALLAEGEPGATAHGLVQPVPRHAVRRVLTPPPLPGPPTVPAQPTVPGPPADDDELFRQIVAGFHEPSTDEVPRWPASEDTGAPGDLDQARRRPPPVDRAPRRRSTDDALPTWLEPDALEPEPDDAVPEDDHFVPPPPPPVPRIRARTLGGAAVLVLGLVLLFVPQVVGLYSSPGVLLAGIALLAGGATLLVQQVRDARDTGPDDGAVV